MREVKSEEEGREALARGEVQFVINIPVDFTRDFLRGQRPVILVEADATDPAATGNAIGSLRVLLNSALQNDLKVNGIDTMIYYPVPLHKMRVFDGRCEAGGNLAESETAVNEVLSLPIEPLMASAIASQIAQNFKRHFPRK